MLDVAVIGGGPGGLHVARLLARVGIDVHVFEEHDRTGEPVHCTGVLAADAFAEFDLPRESILNELTTARFFAPSGFSITYSTRAIEAVAVDRLVFDRSLCESARHAGAQLISGARVTSAEVQRDGVRITLGDGRQFSSRMCVLACGASYGLQQRLGLGIPAVFMQSAQLELPLARPGDVEVHFGRTVAPNGFAWVVPVRRDQNNWCARIGLMCERDATGYFRRFVKRIHERLALDVGGPVPLSPRRKMLPLAPIGRTYTERVLAVGDAAGIVKATTGGGIYYSIVSATIAADVISSALRKNRYGATALDRYERAWRSRLGPEIDAQLALRSLAHRMDDQDIEALFELARTDGVMPIVRKTAQFNQHRALIAALFKHPPARRILFHGLQGASRRLSRAAD
jgi:digeranylgeranylglycerophospholipid reductase